MAEQTYGDWIRSNPPLPTKRYKTKHMAQQTAVEWLSNNFPKVGKYITLEMTFEIHAKFQQAERMHKEQMIDFGNKCQMVHDVEYGDGAVTFLFTPEELYNQTYKTQAQ